jgi:hypothetical protein
VSAFKVSRIRRRRLESPADVARLILIVAIVFALLLVARIVRGVPPKE